MPSPSEHERSGGRLTFSAFLLIALIWLASSSLTSGVVNAVGLAGMTIFIAVGGVVGMMIGFYNFGRERGR